MRGIALIIVQVVISFLLVGLLMPAVLAGIPRARDVAAGPVISVVLMIAVFVVLRVVWPRQRQN